MSDNPYLQAQPDDDGPDYDYYDDGPDYDYYDDGPDYDDYDDGPDYDYYDWSDLCPDVTLRNVLLLWGYRLHRKIRNLFKRDDDSSDIPF